MFLLAVTWIVYKSYGLSGTGFWNIIALQTMIGVAVEMLPLPGAAGVTEGCFTYMFMGIFTAELVKPAMLLSRGLSFYLLLIMSALVTFVAHFIVMRNDKKNGLEGSHSESICMPNTFSCSVLFFMLLAILPSKRSQIPERSRQRKAMDI